MSSCARVKNITGLYMSETKTKLNSQNLLSALNLKNTIIKSPPITKSNDIIISLTTIPNKLITEDFIEVLKTLQEQLVQPKMIVLNICKQYKRFTLPENLEQKITEIKELGITINYCPDMGPITKILGLLSMSKDSFDSNDKIIAVDDDWLIDNKLVYMYSLIYDLYMCDGVGVDEDKTLRWDCSYPSCMDIKNNKDLFYDNYQGSIFGWLSFSFRYKYLFQLKLFYDKLLDENPNIFKHDDLVLALFYRTFKLNVCGINYLFGKTIGESRLSIDEIGLHTEPNSTQMRHELEDYFLNKFKIKYLRNPRNHNHIEIEKTYENYNDIKYVILNQGPININTVLNLNPLDYENETVPNYSLHFTYLNDNNALLTITLYEEPVESKEIEFLLNDKKMSLDIQLLKYIGKCTFILNINNDIRVNKYDNTSDLSIVSTDKNRETSRFKFYSNCSYITGLPYLKSIFFANTDIESFIIDNYKPQIINLFNKLIPGGFKADLFRLLYLYINGGVYHDIKSILLNYNDLNSSIKLNDKIIVDDPYTRTQGIYNAFLFFKTPFNEILKNTIFGKFDSLDTFDNRIIENLKDHYTSGILHNILTSLYSDEPFGITRSTFLGNFFPPKNIYKKYDPIINNLQEWKCSTIINTKNKKTIIKNNFPTYYTDNNYLNTEHYSVFWNNKKIYKNINDVINVPKFFNNSISHIKFINLEKSTERYNNMTNLLKLTNIAFSKVNAIDGKQDVDLKKDYLSSNCIAILMSNIEIACTLSHIKAISEVKDLEGDYFLICEDDITFNNLLLFEESLEQIIKQAPKFDILLLSKIYNSRLPNLYTSWKKDDLVENQVWGAASYIISRTGITNFLNKVGYYDTISNKFEINKEITIEVADVLIFKYLKTYVYKYDVFRTSDIDSTIHDIHLDMHRRFHCIQDIIIINDKLQ